MHNWGQRTSSLLLTHKLNIILGYYTSKFNICRGLENPCLCSPWPVILSSSLVFILTSAGWRHLSKDVNLHCSSVMQWHCVQFAFSFKTRSQSLFYDWRSVLRLCELSCASYRLLLGVFICECSLRVINERDVQLCPTGQFEHFSIKGTKKDSCIY